MSAHLPAWRATARAFSSRLAARDPGWRRARRALRATAGAAISLGINTAISSAAHQASGVALLGAVVAMVSGLSVTEDERRDAARTYLLLPFVASASVAGGAALSGNRLLADTVFVAIVFAATTLRRRGPRWSAAGFLAFMAYFFSQFLQARPAQVPWLALAATIGVLVAALLRLVVLPERPERALRRLLRALEGQTSTLLDAAVEVLGDPRFPQRLRRRAVSASGDLNRVALMVEQQLGIAPTRETESAGGASPLRDRVFLLEVAAAHTVSAVRGAVRDGLSDGDRRALATELSAVSRAIRSGRSPMTLHSYAAHIEAETRAPSTVGKDATSGEAGAGSHSRYAGARHVRSALAELAETASALQRGGEPTEQLQVWDDPEDADDDAGSSNSGSTGTDPRLGLKQGIQATVAVVAAIALGELLSPSRWYWAAIAAYIVFVGADTRGATLRRAVARTVGTVGGLIGGLLVASLVSGSTPFALVLVFVCLFAAWWLQPVSFLASSIAVTIVLALLYVLLGMFNRHVLELRVEETAVGALLGGAAALLLLPARSSPVVRFAEADVLDRLADLLRTVRNRSGGGSHIGTALRAVDSAFQDLRDVARPVAKGVPGAAARQVEQRVFALSAATYSARMLVSALLRTSGLRPDLLRRLDRIATRIDALAASARDKGPGAERDAGDPGSGDSTESAQSEPPGEPAPPPADRSQRAATAQRAATVALERLEAALTRWSEPGREPTAPGTPATNPSDWGRGRSPDRVSARSAAAARD